MSAASAHTLLSILSTSNMMDMMRFADVIDTTLAVCGGCPLARVRTKTFSTCEMD